VLRGILGVNTSVDIDGNHHKMRAIFTATHRPPKLPMQQDPMESFRQYSRRELFVSVVQNLGILQEKSAVSEVLALVRRKEYFYLGNMQPSGTSVSATTSSKKDCLLNGVSILSFGLITGI
jgi:hypothetical protein